MAILKIARMGHPVLSLPAKAVSDPRAPEIRHLVNDMVETMMDANGAGLAAPQVHVPLRVVVFQAPEGRTDLNLADEERFDHTAPLTVLINPEIEILAPEKEGGWEGCLSVPGLRGWVEERPNLALLMLTLKRWHYTVHFKGEKADAATLGGDDDGAGKFDGHALDGGLLQRTLIRLGQATR